MDTLTIDPGKTRDLYEERDWSSALLNMGKLDKESWLRQMHKLQTAESRLSFGLYNICVKCGRELSSVTRTAKHDIDCPYCDNED